MVIESRQESAILLFTSGKKIELNSRFDLFLPGFQNTFPHKTRQCFLFTSNRSFSRHVGHIGGAKQ